MEIKVLEDEARAHSLDRETAERNRKRADVLRKDLTAKEQERWDLLQRPDITGHTRRKEKKRLDAVAVAGCPDSGQCGKLWG